MEDYVISHHFQMTGINNMYFLPSYLREEERVTRVGKEMLI